MDTDNVPNNSAVTEDPVAPSLDDLTLDPNANGPSYTKAEHDAASVLLNMGFGFGTGAATDANTAGPFYRDVGDDYESDSDDDEDSGLVRETPNEWDNFGYVKKRSGTHSVRRCVSWRISFSAKEASY